MGARGRSRSGSSTLSEKLRASRLRNMPTNSSASSLFRSKACSEYHFLRPPPQQKNHGCCPGGGQWGQWYGESWARRWTRDSKHLELRAERTRARARPLSVRTWVSFVSSFWPHPHSNPRCRFCRCAASSRGSHSDGVVRPYRSTASSDASKRSSSSMPLLPAVRREEKREGGRVDIGWSPAAGGEVGRDS